MKTTIYYFELENETISVKMTKKTREELKTMQEALNAKCVYIYIYNTKLILDL